MAKRAVFFDRDNTIIKDVPYLGDPAQVQLMPFAEAALRLLKSKGFLLFIISNQSGVGRGWLTEDQVHSVNEEMNRRLGENYFREIYICYDPPEPYPSECRKPSPAMIFKARDEHDLDLAKSFFVGDKPSDIQCGQNAGCKSVLVLAGKDLPYQQQARREADYVAGNLMLAAKWICSQTKNME
jgi:D-glycero-D-manno-heptose 1,7-bisphosphate phosphatase